MRRASAQRGSVYFAVLGAAMLVTILGVSALKVLDLERDAATLDRHAVQAGFSARSAVELALRQVQDDANWRATFTHDTWTTPVTFNGAQLSYKFVSTTGSSLTAAPNDPVRVFGRGVVGDAARIESVLIRPIDLKGTTPGSTILSNGSFSLNDAGWSIAPWVTALIETASPRTVPGALTLDNRQNVSDGAKQNVSALLVNGMTYETSVWVRSQALTSDSAIVRLVVRSSGSGTRTYASAATAFNSLGWTRVATSFTPRWKGQLLEACWEVVTVGYAYDLSVDDAHLAITITSPRPHTLDPSSWQAELP